MPPDSDVIGLEKSVGKGVFNSPLPCPQPCTQPHPLLPPSPGDSGKFEKQSSSLGLSKIITLNASNLKRLPTLPLHPYWEIGMAAIILPLPPPQGQTFQALDTSRQDAEGREEPFTSDCFKVFEVSA